MSCHLKLNLLRMFQTLQQIEDDEILPKVSGLEKKVSWAQEVLSRKDTKLQEVCQSHIFALRRIVMLMKPCHLAFIVSHPSGSGNIFVGDFA